MNRAITDTLAWALVHFLWQGTLIALLAGLANAALRKARPETRYALFCAALVLMLVVPAVTALVLYEHRPPEIAMTRAGATAPAAALSVDGVEIPQPSEPDWLPWLVRIWLAGVVLLTLRSVGGWIIAQRLKHWKTTAAADSIQRMASRLRARLDLRRAVRVFESSVAEVPAVVGWIRPVILLPVSALTALSPEQIELLLAHELAHIRRHDYLVNLVQTMIETLLFYHPAVWWVSAQVRAEREHCCDDLAIQACGDAVAYAHTLARLEGLRGGGIYSVAATGGSLLDRIQRILNRPRKSRYTPPAWVGALLPVAVVLIAVFSVRPARVQATAPETESSAPAPDPAPAVERSGFLAGLSDAGYSSISVDEIIALKQNGVDPRYIKEMKSAGLGAPSVQQLIKLHSHGTRPEFVGRLAKSGLLDDLSFEVAIRLQDNGVDPDDMARIRALGFGPFHAEDAIRLRHQGATAAAFEALKEAGVERGGVAEAIELRKNDVSAERIRSMKEQGFKNLTLEQIIKLRKAGII